jgi:hypothetical protein
VSPYEIVHLNIFNHRDEEIRERNTFGFEDDKNNGVTWLVALGKAKTGNDFHVNWIVLASSCVPAPLSNYDPTCHLTI